jgi:hypothetical protein
MILVPKRLFWFTAGVATGALGAAYGYARLREARGALEADQLADTAARVARRLGGTVRQAVGEGIEAMREAEVAPANPAPGRNPPG